MSRNSSIDVLKAFASQVIVLHHLLLYTPMSPALQAEWPTLLGFIADEGRYVVQIFLVIGGFLASQSLFNMLKQGRGVAPWDLLKKRYVRLAKPFWVAIAVAVLLSWLGGKVAVHDEVSDLPGLMQLLAHVFLVHDVVGVEALSAGVWYVAIDLQLFAVMVLMAWLSQRLGKTSWIQPEYALLLLAGAMAVSSLWWWNLHSGHDEWAWYFFGSYGLGVIAYWAQHEDKKSIGSVLIAGFLSLALFIEWRERLLLTGLTALLLLNSNRLEQIMTTLARGPVRWLGDISYSVFLIHYGVAVFASSLVIALDLQGFLLNLLAFAVTWAVSILAGWVLYRLVEKG